MICASNEGSPREQRALLQRDISKDMSRDILVDDSDWKCWNIWAWVGECLVRFILTIVFGLSALHIEPIVRYVEVHDWHLYNFPHAEPETIEPEAVFISIVLVPVGLVMIVCLIAWHIWRKKYTSVYRTSDSLQARIRRRVFTEFLIAAMALSLALLTNGVVTDVIKNAYGRPRPDFLSRCFTPTGASENHDPLFTKANGDNLWLTLPSRRYPEAMTENQREALRRFGENGTETGTVVFPYIEDVKSIINIEDCINSAGGVKLLLFGGRRSFPSGHTSFAFSGATFCALYCYYWLGKIRSSMNLGRSGVNFPGVSLKLGILFLWFIPAIYVAITRTQDYRHHPGDVFGGAFIGILVTTFTFIQYYDLRSPTRSSRRKNSVRQSSSHELTEQSTDRTV